MNRNPGQGARPGATINPAMYRAPYQQQYSISQPRTGLPYGTLPQQHRAQQVVGAAPQSQGQSQVGAAAYLRQQQSTGFQFSSSIQQQQPSSAASLQAAHSNPLAATANGSTVSSAQLAQQLAASNTLQSQNDGQLDPNDFPALGPTFHNSGNAPSATQQPNASQSYASQAQQHSANSAALTGNGFTGQGTNAPRDFTNPDEFPALGGQQVHDNHPPGLNGFSTQSSQPTIPPMMHRTILQADPEKRLQALKASAQSGLTQQGAPPLGYTTNGVSSQPHIGATAIDQNQLGASFSSSLHPAQQQAQRANSVTGQSTPDPNLNAQTHGQTHTPAEQVLHSPADRWGLQALVRMLRNPNQEANLLADGQDLAILGLELDNPGSLYRTFATPWADYSASQPLAEPNYHLPACYNVTPPAPSAKRAKQWSDETLFFAFYAMPRDQFQDVAAQELYEREWRYHKELRTWITKGPEQQPSSEGELFTIWDVEAWERVHRPFKFNFADLEERRGHEAAQQVSASAGVMAPSHIGVGVPQTQPVQSQFAPMHMRA